MTDALVIRRADIQDAPRLAELFELVYRKSSHPLQNFRDVAAFLDNPDELRRGRGARGSRRCVDGNDLTPPGTIRTSSVARLRANVADRHRARRRGASHDIGPLLFFRSLLQKGGEGLDEDTIRELRLLRPVYERLFQFTGAIGEVLLFRVAYANDTTPRSCRRRIDTVLRRVG